MRDSPACLNLVTQPWIAVVDLTGQPQYVTLRDALVSAHHYRNIAGETVQETFSLHRLLLTVLYRVFAPYTAKQWLSLWQRKDWKAAAINSYLDDWCARFETFDRAHPFYQCTEAQFVAHAKRLIRRPVSDLIHHWASNNNAVLFDHHRDNEPPLLTPSEAARALVTYQITGLGGGISGLNKSDPERRSFRDAPCARGLLFTAVGRNLFETLALNLVPFDWHPLWQQLGQLGKPIWEMDDPFVPVRTKPSSLLEYLSWPARLVMLLPEDTADGLRVAYVNRTQGLRMDMTDGSAGGRLTDPAKVHIYGRDKRLHVVSWQEGRALWRDAHVLLRLAEPGTIPPAALVWMSQLVRDGHLPPEQRYQFMVSGMATSNSKIFFSRQESMPLPAAYLCDDQMVAELSEALKYASDLYGQLLESARWMAYAYHRANADAPPTDRPDWRQDRYVNAQVETYGVRWNYWWQLEGPFYALLQDLPQDAETSFANWITEVNQAAWRTLDQAGKTNGSATARALRATEVGRKRLAGGLAKVRKERGLTSTASNMELGQ